MSTIPKPFDLFIDPHKRFDPRYNARFIFSKEIDAFITPKMKALWEVAFLRGDTIHLEDGRIMYMLNIPDDQLQDFIKMVTQVRSCPFKPSMN